MGDLEAELSYHSLSPGQSETGPQQGNPVTGGPCSSTSCLLTTSNLPQLVTAVSGRAGQPRDTQ
eukprot:8587140-Prorocentrum_lima.AAC.1